MACVPLLVYNVKETVRHARYLSDPSFILVFYGSEAM